MTGIYYTPAAALQPDGGDLLTITNQITMRDVNRYKTEADTKSANPIVNPDYTLTRPKRLNKFEKINGMKVVKAGWIESGNLDYHLKHRRKRIQGRKNGVNSKTILIP